PEGRCSPGVSTSSSRAASRPEGRRPPPASILRAAPSIPRRQAMPSRPAALDHVNVYVRNAERSHQWYTDVLGLHTQDVSRFPDGKVRAVFLACDPEHAHDIALFHVGEDATGPQKGQVGLNHVAWRMATLD